MAPGGGTPSEPDPAAAAAAPTYPSLPSPSAIPTPPLRSGGRPTLGPAFAGSYAAVGKQVAAFTIDVLAVAAVTVTVHLWATSVPLTVLAALESLVFLWVLEARTGLSLGALVLRMRHSIESRPYSPGAGRAVGRMALTGLGFLVAIVGAWVVAASGAWDRSGRGRSWAAKASGTVAVSTPRRTAARAVSADAGAAAAAPAPGTAAAFGLAAPRVVSTSTLGGSSIEDSASASFTGQGITPIVATTRAEVVAAQQAQPEVPPANQPPSQIPPPPQVQASQPAIAPAPGTAMPPAAAPSDPLAAPATAAPAPASAPVPAPAPVPMPASAPQPAPASALPVTQGALLLVFDTGQRETIALPATVNLGRRPAATAPTDALVSVTDPDGSVSKTHVRLEHSRGRTWVTDQGSTNGTDLLDDDDITTLAPGARTEVPDGARVRMGNRAFTVNVLLDTRAPEGTP
ncbi:FHA domain-containing protein [Demequina sp.]|uniref:FHA domain-containing protein n=1 Tax=Demequina sp. TaxID=2050685 RepID=UPI003A89FA12